MNKNKVSNLIYSFISKANHAAKMAYRFNSQRDVSNMNFYRARANCWMDAAQELAQESGIALIPLYNECKGNTIGAGDTWMLLPELTDVNLNVFDVLQMMA